MKRILAIALSALVVGPAVFAQGDAASIERALAAAPRQMREGATVVKWTMENTYETIKKGTNRIVCYDRSGEPGRAAFAVQCSSIGNLQRIAQNRKFEAELDKVKRQAMIDEAEKNGTRVKPEFGSVWYDMNGADQASARLHVTIAVPGATTKTLGLPETAAQGGVWIMDAGTTTAHLMTPGQ